LDRLLEIAILLAAQSTEAIEPREMLFGFGQVVQHEIGFADVLVGTEVLRVDGEGLLVQRDRLGGIAVEPRGVGQPVPRVGVARRALDSALEQRDRLRILLGLDGLYAGRVIWV